MNDVSILSKSVDELVEILTRGGVILTPTDTLVGIGCRADHEMAVKRIFDIKQRQFDQPLPILVASKARAREVVADIKADAEALMDRYWPGALTILLPAKESATLSLVRAGGLSIGIRQPNHATLLQLLEKCPFPIVGTSANIHGKKPAAEINRVDPLILAHIDGLLEGEGGCGVESTIVDCTKSPFVVVRKGAIDLE
ncbi:MAG: L-threonylcarbamoyladenylate synthase [bacterium]|nr:L-threonylcarbamoyladenylate synthase [bacterium]